MQHSWVSDDEFGMGYLELKPATTVAPKLATRNLAGGQNGSGVISSQNEATGGRSTYTRILGRDPIVKARPEDVKLERTESGTHGKSDVANPRLKSSSSLTNGSDTHTSQTDNPKQMIEPVNIVADDNVTRPSSKLSSESEVSNRLWFSAVLSLLHFVIFYVIATHTMKCLLFGIFFTVHLSHVEFSVKSFK